MRQRSAGRTMSIRRDPPTPRTNPVYN